MLSARNIAALGFMTFAMYLGAGNLIFPPFLGYQAGENFLSGMSGFLLTGVGLPAMALVMVAIVNGSDKLTAALPKPLATSFWVMVFRLKILVLSKSVWYHLLISSVLTSV